MIIDATRTKSTGQRSEEQVAFEKARLLRPSAQCAYAGETIDGREPLAGHMAIRIVVPQERDELTRYVDWRLPELGCESVQTFIQKRSTLSEPWATTAGERLSHVSTYAADETVFSDWVDYEELRPSDHKRRYIERQGVSASACPRCYADDPSADEEYARARVRLKR